MARNRVSRVGAHEIFAVHDVTFTVGDEATNVINVAAQCVDSEGNAIAESVALQYYLSDNADGSTLTSNSAHSSAPAIGTDGLLLPSGNDSQVSGTVVSEADGDFDIDFTDTGTGTVYLVVVLPDGSLAVSGAITHA